MKLIFAQGNPEPEYTGTRHNVGFAVLNRLAEKAGEPWTLKTKFSAYIAELSIDGQKVILAKPATFYNLTGQSVRAIADFYKLDVTKDILVVHDDLALDFGKIRFREKGRDAGNNGIKSIIAHIGQQFCRIRIGVSNESREVIGDTDFVIGRFSADETAILTADIIPQTIRIVDDFVREDYKHVSYDFSAAND